MKDIHSALYKSIRFLHEFKTYKEIIRISICIKKKYIYIYDLIYLQMLI